MVIRVLLVLSCATNTAWATPVELTHQGRLLDAAGAPVTDDASLTFDLLEAGPPLVERWSESQDGVVENGFNTVILGADSNNPLQAEWFSDVPMLRVTDGTGSVLANQVIRPVPTALSSYSVSGGSVDASELRVDGTAVCVALDWRLGRPGPVGR